MLELEVHLGEGFLHELELLGCVTNHLGAVARMMKRSGTIPSAARMDLRNSPAAWSCWSHWASHTSVFLPGTPFTWRALIRYTSMPAAVRTS